MSLSKFEVGDRVINIDHPEWGVGLITFARRPGAWWMPSKKKTDEQSLVVEYSRRGNVSCRNSDGKLRKIP